MDKNKLRSKIEKDLKKQLKDKSVIGTHYDDLVQDYLSLWDLKCDLIADIQVEGIKVMGMHGLKSNPAINDLHKTNDRMLKILDALGLKASPVVEEVPKNVRSSAKDLI